MRSTLILLAALAAPGSAWELADPVSADAPAESFLLMSPHDLTHLVEGPGGVMLARTPDGLFRDVLAFSLVPAAGEYRLRGGLQIRHRVQPLANWHPTTAVSCAACEQARTPPHWQRAFHFSEDPSAPTALKALESAERGPLSFDGETHAEPQALTHLALGPDGLIARKGAAFYRVVGVRLSPSARRTASGDFAVSASNMPLADAQAPSIADASEPSSQDKTVRDWRMGPNGVDEINTYTLEPDGVVSAAHLRNDQPWRNPWSSRELVHHLKDGVQVAEFTHERGRAGSWLKFVLTNGRTLYMRAITNDPAGSGKLAAPPVLKPFDITTIRNNQIVANLLEEDSGWPGAGQARYIAVDDGRIIKTTPDGKNAIWLRALPLGQGIKVKNIRCHGHSSMAVSLSNGATVLVGRKNGALDPILFDWDEDAFLMSLESLGQPLDSITSRSTYLGSFRAWRALRNGRVQEMDAYGRVLKEVTFKDQRITKLEPVTLNQTVARAGGFSVVPRNTAAVLFDDGTVALLDDPAERITQQDAREQGWIR